MKIAYFGGSFNPPTLAHKEIIEALLTKYDEVWLVPNGENYHYKGKELVSFSHRKAMLEQMFPEETKIKILDIEEKKEFKGSAETLEALGHPDFVMGSDCFLDLLHWKNPQKLLSENHFVVFPRGNFSIDDFHHQFEVESMYQQYRDHFVFLPCVISNYCSHDFRLKKDSKILDESVKKYIQNHLLYEV